MHVLIATTGVLSAEPAAEFAKALIGDDGRVTVITVIEVPHNFLEMLEAEEWHPLLDDGTEPERPEGHDDRLQARYVEERGRKLTEPVIGALERAGIRPEVVFFEGDDPATTISEAAEKLEADVVVVGATRKIFDQAAWESVSARVMLESGRAVLVVPPPRRHVAGSAEDA